MPTMPPAGIAGPEVVTWEAPLIPLLIDTEADGLGGDRSVEVASGVLDGMLAVDEVLEGRGSKDVELENGRRVESVETVNGSEEGGLIIMEVDGLGMLVTEEGPTICVMVTVNGPGMFSSSSAFLRLAEGRRFPWRARAAGERR